MTMTTKTMMTIATTIDNGEVRDRCALFFVAWRMLARSLGVEAPAPGPPGRANVSTLTVTTTTTTTTTTTEALHVSPRP